MSTALIIGASRGIGLELVRQYMTDGWRVIATARDDAGRDRVQALGAQCLRVDVAKPVSVTSLAWLLDGEKLDVALFVAGVMDRASAHTPPTQDTFDRVMHTNVMGAMMAIPQIAPMVEAADGVLACISSVMGSLQGTRSSDAALYRISKAALNMVVRTSQPAYPRARLVALHPGWVQTEMGGVSAPLTTKDSVTHIRRTLSQLTAAQCGQFLSHDGSTIPW
ncbi:SDR family oxidoreductase [Limnohabitans sp. B9-3]|uniref:SDR family oxidoreductase n=1 Tax=Limnohabitans sp. B9-3 TaxID=1100707 RepID=UPI000C1E0C7C|nr:SDR family oxidoreductase [Limnohabitans sp. B9-3]PIT78995.1 short chain dehydrogenase [Limnohabitans sp. B9-3]